MKLSSNKAIANFLFVIVGFGMIITLFLMGILKTTYQSDIPECQDLDFTMSICSDNGYKISIQNKAEKSLSLKINGEVDIVQYLVAANQKKIIPLTKYDVGNEIVIEPLAKTSDGVSKTCSAKKVVKQTNTLGKCTK